jgi:hypothetical protein
MTAYVAYYAVIARPVKRKTTQDIYLKGKKEKK